MFLAARFGNGSNFDQLLPQNGRNEANLVIRNVVFELLQIKRLHLWEFVISLLLAYWVFITGLNISENLLYFFRFDWRLSFFNLGPVFQLFDTFFHV